MELIEAQLALRQGAAVSATALIVALVMMALYAL